MQRPDQPRLPERPAVLILGAGGGGLSLLAELAGRGVPALVVEPRGLGWGASGRGTRLLGLAGGGRREREGALELLRSAQHVVRATPVALPLERGEAARAALGMRLLYALQRSRILRAGWPEAIRLDAEQRSLLLPGLRFGREESTRAVYAAVVEDQRLVELRALAARSMRVPVLTRCELLGVDARARGEGAVATLRDRLDGTTRELALLAIVDASAAWSSQARAALDIHASDAPSSPSLVGATLPHRIDAAARICDARGAEPWDIVPAIGGMVVTTRGEGNPPEDPDAGPSEADMERIDAFIAEAFPALAPPRALYWRVSRAGRLPSRGGALRALARVGGAPLFALRAAPVALQSRVARDAASAIEAEIGLSPGAARPIPGHLPGGDIATVAGAEAAARALGLDATQARWMVLRYGSLCEGILELEGGDTPLGSAGFPLTCELTWLHRHEGVRTLSDVLRSWRLPEIAADLDEERRIVDTALAFLARLAGWAHARQEREAKRWWRERALRWTTREDAT